MYPKVKVRVQRDEAERYAYEKTSLESLKAFEWLSLNNSSSSDESPVSIARIPRCYVPMSPPPTFHTSKEQTHKKTAMVENQKTARATSAPRPRAVLSSPDNDMIMGKKKTPVRRETSSGLENHNRHTQCKIFPKSTAFESFSLTRGYSKESTDPKSSIRPKTRAALVDSTKTKSRATLADTSKRATHQKKIAPPSPRRS